MNDLTLQATKREVLRKKTRFLRRQGITPVHLFGHHIESQSLQCDTLQLKQIISQARMTRPFNLQIDSEKQPKNVIIREIQRNAISRELIHVDFYEIRKGQTIRVNIPIVLVGESLALKDKGHLLTHGVSTLHIESLPENLPSVIEVDISVLEDLEQAIHVRDINLDERIVVHTDPEQMVVKISAQRISREEITAEATEGAAEQPQPTEPKPE